jgi:hypothetical protein
MKLCAHVSTLQAFKEGDFGPTDKEGVPTSLKPEEWRPRVQFHFIRAQAASDFMVISTLCRLCDAYRPNKLKLQLPAQPACNAQKSRLCIPNVCSSKACASTLAADAKCALLPNSLPMSLRFTISLLPTAWPPQLKHSCNAIN